MSESKADREMLADLLVEAARPAAGEHVDIEELAGYREGTLDADRERRVQDHLVYCRECAAQLLDLESLSDLDPGPADGAADYEVAAAWRELERRTGRGAGRGGGAGRGWRLLAAVLAVAVVGLSVALTQMAPATGPRDAVAQRPRANPVIVYFDSVTRSDPQVAGAAVVDEGVDLLVVFAPATPREFPDYAVRIEASDGRQRWEGGGLRPSEYDTLRLTVPAGFLTPGEYSIRFEGADGSERVPLGAHRLEVRSAD